MLSYRVRPSIRLVIYTTLSITTQIYTYSQAIQVNYMWAHPCGRFRPVIHSSGVKQIGLKTRIHNSLHPKVRGYRLTTCGRTRAGDFVTSPTLQALSK